MGAYLGKTFFHDESLALSHCPGHCPERTIPAGGGSNQENAYEIDPEACCACKFKGMLDPYLQTS